MPSFVEYNANNLEICTGEKLACALSWMKMMGSPNLTEVRTTDNKTQRCLQRCDLQV
jgi:hypothetical protein